MERINVWLKQGGESASFPHDVEGCIKQCPSVASLVPSVQLCSKLFASSTPASLVAVRSIQRCYEVAQSAPTLPPLGIEKLHAQTQTQLCAAGQHDAARLSSYVLGHRLWQLCRQPVPPALTAVLETPWTPQSARTLEVLAADAYPSPASGHTTELARLALGMFLSLLQSLCALQRYEEAEALLLGGVVVWLVKVVRMVRQALAQAGPAAQGVDPAMLLFAHQFQHAVFLTLWRAAAASTAAAAGAAEAPLGGGGGEEQGGQEGGHPQQRTMRAQAASLRLRMLACEWLCATATVCPLPQEAVASAPTPASGGGGGAPASALPAASPPLLLLRILSASRRAVADFLLASAAAADAAAGSAASVDGPPAGREHAIAQGEPPPASAGAEAGDGPNSPVPDLRVPDPRSYRVAAERCTRLLGALRKAFPPSSPPSLGAQAPTKSPTTTLSPAPGAGPWGDPAAVEAYAAWLGWCAAVCRKAGQYVAAAGVTRVSIATLELELGGGAPPPLAAGSLATAHAQAGLDLLRGQRPSLGRLHALLLGAGGPGNRGGEPGSGAGPEHWMQGLTDAAAPGAEDRRRSQEHLRTAIRVLKDATAATATARGAPVPGGWDVSLTGLGSLGAVGALVDGALEEWQRAPLAGVAVLLQPHPPALVPGAPPSSAPPADPLLLLEQLCVALGAAYGQCAAALIASPVQPPTMADSTPPGPSPALTAAAAAAARGLSLCAARACSSAALCRLLRLQVAPVLASFKRLSSAAPQPGPPGGARALEGRRGAAPDPRSSPAAVAALLTGGGEAAQAAVARLAAAGLLLQGDEGQGAPAPASSLRCASPSSRCAAPMCGGDTLHHVGKAVGYSLEAGRWAAGACFPGARRSKGDSSEHGGLGAEGSGGDPVEEGRAVTRAALALLHNAAAPYAAAVGAAAARVTSRAPSYTEAGEGAEEEGEATALRCRDISEALLGGVLEGWETWIAAEAAAGGAAPSAPHPRSPLSPHGAVSARTLEAARMGQRYAVACSLQRDACVLLGPAAEAASRRQQGGPGDGAGGGLGEWAARVRTIQRHLFWTAALHCPGDTRDQGQASGADADLPPPSPASLAVEVLVLEGPSSPSALEAELLLALRRSAYVPCCLAQVAAPEAQDAVGGMLAEALLPPVPDTSDQPPFLLPLRQAPLASGALLRALASLHSTLVAQSGDPAQLLAGCRVIAAAARRSGAPLPTANSGLVGASLRLLGACCVDGLLAAASAPLPPPPSPLPLPSGSSGGEPCCSQCLPCHLMPPPRPSSDPCAPAHQTEGPLRVTAGLRAATALLDLALRGRAWVRGCRCSAAAALSGRGGAPSATGARFLLAAAAAAPTLRSLRLSLGAVSLGEAEEEHRTLGLSVRGLGELGLEVAALLECAGGPAMRQAGELRAEADALLLIVAAPTPRDALLSSGAAPLDQTAFCLASVLAMARNQGQIGVPASAEAEAGEQHYEQARLLSAVAEGCARLSSAAPSGAATAVAADAASGDLFGWEEGLATPAPPSPDTPALLVLACRSASGLAARAWARVAAATARTAAVRRHAEAGAAAPPFQPTLLLPLGPSSLLAEDNNSPPPPSGGTGPWRASAGLFSSLTLLASTWDATGEHGKAAHVWRKAASASLRVWGGAAPSRNKGAQGVAGESGSVGQLAGFVESVGPLLCLLPAPDARSGPEALLHPAVHCVIRAAESEALAGNALGAGAALGVALRLLGGGAATPRDPPPCGSPASIRAQAWLGALGLVYGALGEGLWTLGEGGTAPTIDLFPRELSLSREAGGGALRCCACCGEGGLPPISGSGGEGRTLFQPPQVERAMGALLATCPAVPHAPAALLSLLWNARGRLLAMRTRGAGAPLPPPGDIIIGGASGRTGGAPEGPRRLPAAPGVTRGEAGLWAEALACFEAALAASERAPSPPSPSCEDDSIVSAPAPCAPPPAYYSCLPAPSTIAYWLGAAQLAAGEWSSASRTLTRGWMRRALQQPLPQFRPHTARRALRALALAQTMMGSLGADGSLGGTGTAGEHLPGAPIACSATTCAGPSPSTAALLVFESVGPGGRLAVLASHQRRRAHWQRGLRGRPCTTGPTPALPAQGLLDALEDAAWAPAERAAGGALAVGAAGSRRRRGAAPRPGTPLGAPAPHSGSLSGGAQTGPATATAAHGADIATAAGGGEEGEECDFSSDASEEGGSGGPDVGGTQQPSHADSPFRRPDWRPPAAPEVLDPIAALRTGPAGLARAWELYFSRPQGPSALCPQGPDALAMAVEPITGTLLVARCSGVAGVSGPGAFHAECVVVPLRQGDGDGDGAPPTLQVQPPRRGKTGTGGALAAVAAADLSRRPTPCAPVPAPFFSFRCGDAYRQLLLEFAGIRYESDASLSGTATPASIAASQAAASIGCSSDDVVSVSSTLSGGSRASAGALGPGARAGSRGHRPLLGELARGAEPGGATRSHGDGSPADNSDAPSAGPSGAPDNRGKPHARVTSPGGSSTSSARSSSSARGNASAPDPLPLPPGLRDEWWAARHALDARMRAACAELQRVWLPGPALQLLLGGPGPKGTGLRRGDPTPAPAPPALGAAASSSSATALLSSSASASASSVGGPDELSELLRTSLSIGSGDPSAGGGGPSVGLTAAAAAAPPDALPPGDSLPAAPSPDAPSPMDGVTAAVAAAVVAAAAAAAESALQSECTRVGGLKLPEVRRELGARGLGTTGKKDELLRRLLLAVEEEAAVAAAAVSAVCAAPAPATLATSQPLIVIGPSPAAPPALAPSTGHNDTGSGTPPPAPPAPLILLFSEDIGHLPWESLPCLRAPPGAPSAPAPLPRVIARLPSHAFAHWHMEGARGDAAPPAPASAAAAAPCAPPSPDHLLAVPRFARSCPEEATGGTGPSGHQPPHPPQQQLPHVRYLVNPSGDLGRTQRVLMPLLDDWAAQAGRAPPGVDPDQSQRGSVLGSAGAPPPGGEQGLLGWMGASHAYLYCGHGAGEAFLGREAVAAWQVVAPLGPGPPSEPSGKEAQHQLLLPPVGRQKGGGAGGRRKAAVASGAPSSSSQSQALPLGPGLPPRSPWGPSPSPALLMGCSSARLVTRGCGEPEGMAAALLAAGAPAVVGTLCDVTDRDIDRYTTALLQGWLTQPVPGPAGQEASMGLLSLPEATAAAREVCRLPYLIGAAPVFYGVPAASTLTRTGAVSR